MRRCVRFAAAVSACFVVVMWHRLQRYQRQRRLSPRRDAFAATCPGQVFLPRDATIVVIISIMAFTCISGTINTETLGPLNASALNFLSEVGRRLSSSSGDLRETSFQFQRLSMTVLRFNSVLIMDSFCSRPLAASDSNCFSF